MKNVFLYSWLFFVVTISNYGQLQNNNWVFGGFRSFNGQTQGPNNLVTYNPSVLPSSIPNSLGFYSLEGNATVSDDNGNLLLFSDGVGIWYFDGNNYFPIPDPLNALNFDFLNGNTSSAQNVIFIPVPNHKYQYYIVTISGATGGDEGIYYSKIDLECTPKVITPYNLELIDSSSPPVAINSNYANQSEALTSVIHSDSDKYWLITYIQKPNGSGFLYSYEVNENEINDTPIGVTSLNISPNDYGVCIKITPDTTGFALSTHGSGLFTGSFDINTGAFTNVQNFIDNTVTQNFFTYGIEFSPDSRNLYYTNILSGPGNNTINRIDFPSMNAATLTKVTTGVGQVYGIQRAIDGNIYVARADALYLFRIDPTISSIPFLNVATDRLNIPNISKLGLPQWVWKQQCESYLKDDRDVLSTNILPTNEERSDYIELTNKIENTARAIYHAADYIVLLPDGGNCTLDPFGFEAEFGSEFVAYIEGCSDNFVYRNSSTDANPNQATEKANVFSVSSQLQIYPNPSNTFVTIALNDSKLKSIVITSLDGKVIQNQNVNSNSEQIDVSGFSNGMYLITVQTDDGQTIIKKFIKN